MIYLTKYFEVLLTINSVLQDPRNISDGRIIGISIGILFECETNIGIVKVKTCKYYNSQNKQNRYRYFLLAKSSVSVCFIIDISIDNCKILKIS